MSPPSLTSMTKGYFSSSACRRPSCRRRRPSCRRPSCRPARVLLVALVPSSCPSSLGASSSSSSAGFFLASSWGSVLVVVVGGLLPSWPSGASSSSSAAFFFLASFFLARPRRRRPRPSSSWARPTSSSSAWPSCASSSWPSPGRRSPCHRPCRGQLRTLLSLSLYFFSASTASSARAETVSSIATSSAGALAVAADRRCGHAVLAQVRGVDRAWSGSKAAAAAAPEKSSPHGSSL